MKQITQIFLEGKSPTLSHVDHTCRIEGIKETKNEQKLTKINHTNTLATRNPSKLCQTKFFFG